MSKNDVSERFKVVEHGKGTIVWSVYDANSDKHYGYFTTPGAAQAYMEVLINDRDEGYINCNETEALSSVSGVLQGTGGEGGDKS